MFYFIFTIYFIESRIALQKLRHNEIIAKKMRDMIKHIVFQSIFILFLLFVATGNQSSHAYDQNTNILNTFFENSDEVI